MADDKRLKYTLVLQNEKFIKQAEKSQEQIMRLEKVSGKSIGQVTRNFNSLNRAPAQNMRNFSKAANDSIKSTNRAFGQLGFQVQDIAVQLQGGQNPLLILGQQGSQVASIFGPGGAVIGAFLAVGAAIATAFLPRLFKSTDAVKDLSTAMEALNAIFVRTENKSIALADSFGDLAKKSRVLADFAVKRALIETTFALQAAKEEAQDLVDSLSPGDIGGRFQTLNFAILNLQESFRDGNLTIGEFEEKFASLFIGAKNIPPEFLKVASGIAAIGEKVRELEGFREALTGDVLGISTESEQKAANDASKIQEKFIQKDAELQNKRIAKLQDSFFSISDSLRSEEEAIRDSYNSRLAIINAFESKFPEARAEANETKLKLEKDFNENMDAIQQARLDSVKSFASSRLGLIAQTLGKETALGKVAFAAQKALAIAESIVATESAAAGALAAFPGPAGIALSAAVRGLGYASVGVIAGQAIASFEGGGSTPSGPRVGGMDGRGGMLAMVHPNEKIIDSTRQDAGGEGWNIVVNNNSNATVTPDINEKDRVISIMVDQVARKTSPFMSAMQQNSNLTIRGNR